MPLLLCRWLLLLLLLVAASHGYAAGDTNGYDSSMCLKEPMACGNVSISYPFYLSSETKELNGYNSSYCGYPGLAIECNDGKPMMQLDGPYKYLVNNISYDSVSLADPAVLEDRSSCPKVDHNVIIPWFSWLYFPGMSIDYLVFFLDCSFTAPIFRPPATYQLTCRNLGAGPSFVLPKDKVPEPEYNIYYGNLSQACNKIIEVPVLSDNSGDSEWSTDEYGRILRQGFQLAWNESKRSANCSQCEQSNGRCGYNQEGNFIGCLCPDGRGHSRKCSDSGDSSLKRKHYIIAGTSSILLLCLLVFVCLYYLKKYRYERVSNGTPRIESFLQRNGTLHPKRCTYAEVKKMTNSFAEKLGQGGFGAVYKGNLSYGRQVAVKMLKDTKGDGEEFMNEVASISRTSHVNIVTLLGFCLQGSKRALIYEYMPNGSLERYAFNKNSKCELSLPWEKLFDIAIGIARGLEYLHRGCNTRIVHFDIKPHNILLDQDFCPKISDFGMAKLCDNKESIISIGGARGTVGYIAPEVFSKQFGAVSSKSDVYSYGMMVLEMVGAREGNIDANSESSTHYFPQWIYEHLNEYCISSSEINGETTELVRKMIVVGLWCIQVISTNRPTMTRVVEMLEGSTIGLELPPKVLLSW